MDRHVATTEFVDGVWREVWETPDGRQYVVDDDGEFVFGVWHLPHEDSDEPAVIDVPPTEDTR
jgi:hypothetical protein